MPNAASYDLVNANLTSKKIFPGADASFGVYNVLNEHPQMVGGGGLGNGGVDFLQNTIPADGRSVQAKLQCLESS